MTTPPETPGQLPLSDVPDDYANTLVRLPLLPSPDEMAELSRQRRAIEDALAGQTQGALSAVTECSQLLAEAAGRLDRAVAAARATGAGWTAIGRAAGISRQAAAERWGR